MLALALGIFAADALAFAPRIALALAIPGAALAACALRRPRLRFAAALCIAFAAGALSFSLRLAAATPGPGAPATAIVEARIAERTRLPAGRVRLVLRDLREVSPASPARGQGAGVSGRPAQSAAIASRPPAFRLPRAVELYPAGPPAVRAAGAARAELGGAAARARAASRWDAAAAGIGGVAVGARVRAALVLRAAPGVRNPGGRNARRALARRGIGARARLQHPQLYAVVAPPLCPPCAALAARRLAAVRRLEAEGRGGALLAALSLGARGGLPQELRSAAGRTGLAHLLAVSGLHLAMVAGAVFAPARFALAYAPGARRDARRLALAAALAAGLIYGWLAGFGVPMRRALVFLATWVAASAARRPVGSLSRLALAAGAVLAWDPAALFSIGAQLSFAAVAGLMLGGKPTAAADGDLPGDGDSAASADGGLPGDGDSAASADGGLPGDGDSAASADGGLPGGGNSAASADGGLPGGGDSAASTDGGLPGDGDSTASADGGLPGDGDSTASADGGLLRGGESAAAAVVGALREFTVLLRGRIALALEAWRRSRVASACIALLRTSAGAVAATAPLAAHHFGAASPFGWLANLLAVPLTALLLLPLALCAAALALLAPGGAWEALLPAAAQVGELAAAAVLAWAERVPAAAQGAAPAPWVMFAAALLALPTLRARQTRWRLLGALAISLAVALGPPAPLAPPLPRAVFLDVGHGDAVLVQGRSAAVLVDAGAAAPQGPDRGATSVLPALRALGVRRLDLVVLSHGDLDHRGGLPSVLRGVPTAALWLPPGGRGDPALAELRAAARARGTRIAERGAGAAPQQLGDLLLRPLWPPRGIPAPANERSLVLEISLASGAGRRLLLTGDIGARTERALLARHAAPGALRAEVLKLAHHGSRTSSSAAFLKAVSPQLAIVSAPHRGRFGMPHIEVTGGLNARRIPWLWTGRDGAVLVPLEGHLCARRFATHSPDAERGEARIPSCAPGR